MYKLMRHVTTTIFILDPADQHLSSPSGPPSLSCPMPLCLRLFSWPRTCPSLTSHQTPIHPSNPHSIILSLKLLTSPSTGTAQFLSPVHLGIIMYIILYYNDSPVREYFKGCLWSWLSYLCISSRGPIRRPGRA